jgi:hypothetical protein
MTRTTCADDLRIALSEVNYQEETAEVEDEDRVPIETLSLAHSKTDSDSSQWAVRDVGHAPYPLEAVRVQSRARSQDLGPASSNRHLVKCPG